MRNPDRIIAIAALLSVAPIAEAQSAALQYFQQRQLQLDRMLALASAHAGLLRKRGGISVPTKVIGKILETHKNSDGSLTAVTTHGDKVTYDPQIFRPYYNLKRDETLFGLIPDQSGSFGAFWTRAPSTSGFRTSFSYSDLPYGKLPTPDAKQSTTLSLSQSTDWLEGAATSDSFGLNGSYQLNSDQEPVQFTGGLGVNVDHGFTRQLSGCLSVARTINSLFTCTATGSYLDGGMGGNGYTASLNMSTTVTPKLVIYVDGQLPSTVQGLSSWDVGIQAALAPNLSLTAEKDQGQTWFLGLTHRFVIR